MEISIAQLNIGEGDTALRQCSACALIVRARYYEAMATRKDPKEPGRVYVRHWRTYCAHCCKSKEQARQMFIGAIVEKELLAR